MVHNKKSLKKSLKVSFAGLRQHLNNVIKGPSSVFCFFFCFAIQSIIRLVKSWPPQHKNKASHNHIQSKKAKSGRNTALSSQGSGLYVGRYSFSKVLWLTSLYVSCPELGHLWPHQPVIQCGNGVGSVFLAKI